MKAVVSRIAFGFGNQLLQFAAGYGLAKRLQCPLDLDVSWFDQDPGTTAPRDLTVTKVVSNESYRRILKYSHRSHFLDRVQRILALSVRHPYRHGVPIWRPAARHHQPLESIPRPVCIIGVPSHNEAMHNYPNHILDLFFDGLNHASSVPKPCRDYAFVHVRLGDFVSSPHVKKKMVQLSQDYYEKAMRLYEQRHGKKRWILLSDEPKKAIEKMPSGFSVEPGNGASEIDDLFLMSRSVGGVTANSTFSLWGGLLAERNGGSVVSPAVWREDGRPPPKLPSGWMRV